MDRRTSLLSHVQYPVPYQSRLQRIYRSCARKANEFGVGPKPIATRKHKERYISSLSSMDSDLEAFSHYPADGSFGALAVQPTP